jgi:hypothetical protein
MKKLKRILKNILFVTVPMLLVIFLLLEIASRIFFPGNDAPKTIYDEKDRLVKYNRDYGTTGLWTAGRFSQQRARWHINNDGWNSPIDFFPEKKPGVKRIAVIGDSFVEAWQVDSDKAYPDLMEDSLGPKYEVYRFGIAGAPLSQYLHMSRYVEKKYSPDIYIFNLVHNDFHESVNGVLNIPYYMTIKMNADSSFTEVQPVKPEHRNNRVPGGFLLRKSSFCRYVYYNLNLINKFKSKKWNPKETEMNLGVNEILSRKDLLQAVTRYMLATIKAELGSKKIIFVMDGARRNIYNGNLATARITWLNSMVGGVCKELDFPFIDLTPYMLEDYKKNGKRFETDYDGHWDEYGHQFVASVLYEYFKSAKL